jgi:dihydrofolate reductase
MMERSLGKVKVAGFSVSMDGYAAGPEQSLKNPLGRGGMALHQWLLKTCMFRKAVLGQEGGTTGPDNDFAEKAHRNVGAWILGRNMFGPVRGPWQNNDWKGWWGDNPPYHVPVFVLTHHARDPIPMEGGTAFYFVTDGIEPALKKAKEAAKDKDVRIGGGVSTVRQYLQARLIDEMHLAFSPIFLGQGENLLAGIDLPKLGFERVERMATEDATHVILRKS